MLGVDLRQSRAPAATAARGRMFASDSRAPLRESHRPKQEHCRAPQLHRDSFAPWTRRCPGAVGSAR